MVESSLPPAGKPPRTGADIRGALKGMSRGGEQPAPGAHAGGMGSSEPLLLASFHDRDVAGRFQDRLRGEGVYFSTRVRARKVEILVDAGDRAQAAAIMKLHQRQDPDRPPAGMRRSYDFLIFGALIGGMGGMVIVFGTTARAAGAAAMVATVLLGGVCGHLLDRLIHRRKGRSAWAVGVLGLLLIVAVVAGMFALGKLLPVLLRQ